MIDFKDAGMKRPSDPDITLRRMSASDWSNYVLHIVEAGELYFQYGCEPTEELIECIRTMTPEVIYYSVYLKAENVMVGYIGITPKTSSLEFYIFQEFRKRGLGTAAVNSLIRAWFSGQATGSREAKIEAETLSENQASIRLLEKLGFQKKAVGCRMILSEEGAGYRALGLYAYILKNDLICKVECTK